MGGTLPGAGNSVHGIREQADAADQMLLHRRFGNAETAGNFLLGQILDPPHPDDFPAAAGQPIEERRQPLHLLPAVRGAFWGDLIYKDV